MKSNLHFVFFTFILLFVAGNSFGQGNYNAGTYSGTGGSFNVHVGYRAGEISTGTYNSFIGSLAGYVNTTGSFNIFIGTYAGSFNTTATNNCFIGDQAGRFNKTGSYNSFIGSGAGYSNTSGNYNNFLGFQAGHDNLGGNNNNFLGYQAGYSNTGGSYNTFLGNYAGYKSTTGIYNTFLGFGAGNANTTGSNNTFLGVQAGNFNTIGNKNTFHGYGSGFNNSTGSNNVFLGYNSGFSSTASNNTFIGNSAGEKTTVGGVNTFVGSGAGFNNTSGYHNVFIGRSTAQNNTSGYENTFLGNTAGNVNTTGNKQTALGYLAGPSLNNLSNATAIGHRAQVSVSNALVLGSINGVNGALADAKVGIRTTAPAYNLQVNGTAGKPGGGSWTAASDKRLKQNIKNFTEGLSIIEQIRPVTFHYNGKAGLPTEKEYVGVIAQEMQKIAPYMVGEFSYQDSTGTQEKYLDYDATALTYILVNAVKEQQGQITTLKQENEELKEKVAEIESLQQELAAMKELLIKYIPEAGSQQARLGQNTPNPYTQFTSIPYQLPARAKSAFLKVYSSSGQEVKSFELRGKINGEVTLSAGMLGAGSYVYSLFVDGVKIDSKKLVLTP
jgi:trimeric autotransporter adhesin